MSRVNVGLYSTSYEHASNTLPLPVRLRWSLLNYSVWPKVCHKMADTGKICEAYRYLKN